MKKWSLNVAATVTGDIKIIMSDIYQNLLPVSKALLQTLIKTSSAFNNNVSITKESDK